MLKLRGIDPQWVFWIGVAVVIEQGIGHGSVQLNDVVPAAWFTYVTGWSNLLAFIGVTFMTALSGVSSDGARSADQRAAGIAGRESRDCQFSRYCWFR